jgi:hypothetical protein
MTETRTDRLPGLKSASSFAAGCAAGLGDQAQTPQGMAAAPPLPIRRTSRHLIFMEASSTAYAIHISLSFHPSRFFTALRPCYVRSRDLEQSSPAMLSYPTQANARLRAPRNGRQRVLVRIAIALPIAVVACAGVATGPLWAAPVQSQHDPAKAGAVDRSQRPNGEGLPHPAKGANAPAIFRAPDKRKD